jgi:hypothetical protein
MKITLTGWRAVAALVVVVGFIGFRYVTARKALDAEGKQVLEEWVALELQRPLPADRALSLEERGYRMSYSPITGWVHRGTASAVSYHLALF